MKVKEKKAKTIISDSGLYGVDYSVNPYVGCEHACKYCFARFMKKYSNVERDWGDFVVVKTNARNVLEKDLQNKKKGSILLSSVTDPYQPLEKDYEITSSLLDRLANTSFFVNILTKNSLIRRDIEILKSFRENRLSVGFTINFLEEKHRKNWEPRASKISDRIKTLKRLSDEGISTYIHIGPFFNNITNLERIIKKLKDYVSEIQIENISTTQTKSQILNTVRKKYPTLVEEYEKIIKNPEVQKVQLKNFVNRIRKKTELPIVLYLD